MLRKVVEIDQEKCVGCGLCIDACHEGALELVEGKAKLVREDHCDGLGNCLPECPTGAISVIEKEINAGAEKPAEKDSLACGCPGTLAKSLKPKRESISEENKKQADTSSNDILQSELRQWPVQLKLINPDASYLAGGELLFAADCTAYAYARFHQDFMKNKITIIACPKLDDNQYHIEKMTEILKKGPKSITLVRMNVPCCSGLQKAVKEAMLNAKVIVPYKEIVITPEGEMI
ncbi:ferredoxin [Syntrophobotulus glycolicus DSM 8271]|uniref:Ferredoxin n=1 Tax=Syntrophobotulus glycolicus (strain DSM 8271 / FlGlyR) TaxID=645991 RepID=F0SUU0_SYNGF|nr:4Fe-4S dicluster domain-containing protein [Syntrophobotulus glycolicus]ADY56656.1 ferredoxin [Syntrophobotulus glycolicus DSM 8271]